MNYELIIKSRGEDATERNGDSWRQLFGSKLTESIRLGVWMLVGLIVGGLLQVQVLAQQGNAMGTNSPKTKVADVAVRGSGLDREGYVELAETQWLALKKTFEERQRKKDPLGTLMDPGTFEEIVEQQVGTEETESIVEKVIEKVISLQDVVNKFQVTGVNAKKQMVMVGFRPLYRGDLVKIKHLGAMFELRIEKITTNEVVFMNIKNQETATVRLGVYRGIKVKGGNSQGRDSLRKNMIKDAAPLTIE